MVATAWVKATMHKMTDPDMTKALGAKSKRLCHINPQFKIYLIVAPDLNR